MSSTATRTTARADASRRLSTETKVSYKTTEFIVFVLVLLGIFIASAVSGEGGEGGFTPLEAWRLITFLSIGYMVSRGLSKAGSREPYWSDGTNSNRDTDRS